MEKSFDNIKKSLDNNNKSLDNINESLQETKRLLQDLIAKVNSGAINLHFSQSDRGKDQAKTSILVAATSTPVKEHQSLVPRSDHGGIFSIGNQPAIDIDQELNELRELTNVAEGEIKSKTSKVTANTNEEDDDCVVLDGDRDKPVAFDDDKADVGDDYSWLTKIPCDDVDDSDDFLMVDATEEHKKKVKMKMLMNFVRKEEMEYAYKLFDEMLEKNKIQDLVSLWKFWCPSSQVAEKVRDGRRVQVIASRLNGSVFVNWRKESTSSLGDDRFKDKDKRRKDSKHMDWGGRDKERSDCRCSMEVGNSIRDPEHENPLLEQKKPKEFDIWKNVDKEARVWRRERELDFEGDRPEKRSRCYDKESDDECADGLFNGDGYSMTLSWGIGHIEAEAEMPDQPVTLRMMDQFLMLGYLDSLPDESLSNHKASINNCSVKVEGMMSLAIDDIGARWMWGSCLQKSNSTENGFSLHAIAYVGGDKNYGAKATINVWEPKIQQPIKFSLSQLWIFGGSFGQDLNSIEAGWQDSPDSYGDNNTRFFTYWTSDACQATGCYNALCSGFIQLNREMAADTMLRAIGSSFEERFEFGTFDKEPKFRNSVAVAGSLSRAEGVSSSTDRKIKMKDVSQYMIDAAKVNPKFAQKLHDVLVEIGVVVPPNLFTEIYPKQLDVTTVAESESKKEEERIKMIHWSRLLHLSCKRG